MNLLTDNINILEATAVNELLDPLTLWTFETWGHEGTENIFPYQQKHQSLTLRIFSLFCPSTPALKGKTPKKLNTYRENNKGKWRSSIFLTVSDEISEA